MAGRGFGVRKVDQSDRYQPTAAHSPLEQCKRHILENCLPLVRAEHKEMIIPCYMQDTDDYRQALELEEIKQAIASKRLEKVTLQPVDKHGRPLPDIVIATVDDVAQGKLDDLMKEEGWY
jgi:hypothetical protein